MKVALQPAAPLLPCAVLWAIVVLALVTSVVELIQACDPRVVDVFD